MSSIFLRKSTLSLEEVFQYLMALPQRGLVEMDPFRLEKTGYEWELKVLEV